MRDFYNPQALKSRDQAKSGRRHLDYTNRRRAARLPGVLGDLKQWSNSVTLCKKGQAITRCVLRNGSPGSDGCASHPQGKVKIGRRSC